MKVEKDVLQESSKLSKHTQEFAKKEASKPSGFFTPQVLKVGRNVYVAIGYGLANSIMLEGEEGVVIIDTLESCEVARWVEVVRQLAREVREAFAGVTSKPVVGIILTHFHADHAYGTSGHPATPSTTATTAIVTLGHQYAGKYR